MIDFINRDKYENISDLKKEFYGKRLLLGIDRSMPYHMEMVRLIAVYDRFDDRDARCIYWYGQGLRYAGVENINVTTVDKWWF